MRLLLDEMIPPVIAAQLRLRGHDVDAVASRRDLVKQTDAVIYAVAQREGRVLVTENIDDLRLIASHEIDSGRTHTGLIFTNARRVFRGEDRYIGRMVFALDAILLADDDLTNREIWL